MSSIISYYCALKGISAEAGSTAPAPVPKKENNKETQQKKTENNNSNKKQKGGNAPKQQSQPTGNNNEPVPPALLYYCAIKQIPIHPTSNTNAKERQANFVNQKVANIQNIPKAEDFAKERQENFKNQRVADLETIPKSEDLTRERQENFLNQKVTDIENASKQTIYPPSDPINLPSSDPQHITYVPAEGTLYPPTDPIHLQGDQFTPKQAEGDSFVRNSDYPPSNPNDLEIDDSDKLVFPTPDGSNTLYPPTEVGNQPLQPIHDSQQGFYPPGQPGYGLPPSDPTLIRNSDYPPTNPHDLPSSAVLHSQTVNISAGNSMYPPTDPSQIQQPYIATLEGVTSPDSIKYASIYNNPVQMYPPDQQYGFNAVPAVNLRSSGSQLPNASGFFPTVPEGANQDPSGFFSGPPPQQGAPAEGLKRRNTFSVPQEYQQLYPTPVREAIPEIASHLNNFPIQLNQSGNVPLEFPGAFSANTQSPASIIFSNNQENRQTTRLASQLFSDIFTRADKNDDGNVTFDEFTDYFEEQVLNTEELKDLFNAADLNHNQNISLAELEEFFRASFQSYAGLFDSLAQMHSAISVTLNGLYKHYPYENKTTQFTTRVLINEFLLQIKSLFETVHASLESLQVTSTGSAPQAHFEHHEPEPSSSTRNTQIQVSNANDDLREQVNRLASVVNKLVNAQARLQPVEKETGRVNPGNSYLVVSRSHEVSEDSGALSGIQDLFAGYVSNLTSVHTEGLLSIYVRQDAAEENKLVIHEIWESKSHLEAHNRTKLFKQFQKDIIDFVDSPVVVSAAEVPQAWWIGN